ncbi:hypothetical protein [Desulfohalovibrio reitneri]|uniref:hypothetical protein n=1 Tax=Desulfohalovibrio reitneri TaxID=1307759 RepID=UPI0004A76DFF|nr:hypothetical protein [Desulfohalovibrio reitneri]
MTDDGAAAPGSAPASGWSVGGRSADRLRELAERVSLHTGLPRLPPDSYRVLYEELAAELHENGFSLARTPRSLRDRCRDRGVSLSKSQANFILMGMARSGHEFGAGDDHPAALAKALSRAAWALCREHGPPLSKEETGLLIAWLVPRLRAG